MTTELATPALGDTRRRPYPGNENHYKVQMYVRCPGCGVQRWTTAQHKEDWGTTEKLCHKCAAKDQEQIHDPDIITPELARCIQIALKNGHTEAQALMCAGKLACTDCPF
jgi:hypothetical protein